MWLEGDWKKEGEEDDEGTVTGVEAVDSNGALGLVDTDPGDLHIGIVKSHPMRGGPKLVSASSILLGIARDLVVAVGVSIVT